VILGIGIDVVHVDRIRRWRKVAGLAERFFHPEEIAAAAGRGAGAAHSLAARFAAKEAFGKALGTGLAGIRLRDLQVVNSHNGRPDMVLHGSALARFREAGASAVPLSRTHASDNALAVVVIAG